ncbi:MAG: hypothetical protein ACTSU5_02205 [Promethearchaeota archaeon]
MSLPLTTILNGSSALACVTVGFAFGAWFVVLYARQKKPLMPLVAVTAFAAGCIFLGPAVSFLHLAATGRNISSNLYGLLSYTSPPIATTCSMYVGFAVFSPERKGLVLKVYAAISVVYEVILYAFTSQMVAAVSVGEGELLDVSLQSAILVLIAFFILSLVFILARGFYKLHGRLPEGPDRRHAAYLTIGWVLFAVAGTMDAIVPAEFIHLIVVARGMMIVGYSLVFLGFSPPRKELPA